MDEYRIGLVVEPTDDYKKALKDMLQMKESFSKLNNCEKDRLVREVFALEISQLTPEQVMLIDSLMKEYFESREMTP